MKSLRKALFITLLTIGMVINLSFKQEEVTAQNRYSPIIYGYFGEINPLIGGGSFLGGNYYNPLFSPLSLYTSPYYYSLLLRQVYEIYSYLNYCLRFYEIARQTPFFYLYDQVADYIGANLYNYARKLGVSPQEAIIYFIRENFLSPQS